MANIRRMTRKRLGELLLQEALINEEHLETALEEQQQTGELIGEILVRKGYVTESDIARTIATQFSFPFLSVSRYYISPEMVNLFALEELEKSLFIPIDRFGDVLSIVVAGLLDQDIIERIESQTSCAIQVYVGTVTEVKTVIKEKFAMAMSAKAAAAKRKGAEEAAAADALDVTAPPKARAAARKTSPSVDAAEDDSSDDDLVDLSDAMLVAEDDLGDDAGDDMGDDISSADDESVVKELEEQFKKFHFPVGEDSQQDTDRT